MFRKSLAAIFLVVVVVFLVVGCGSSGPADPEYEEFTGIAPGKGVDGVYLGMSAKDVETVLGSPEERDIGSSSGDLEYLYPSRGIVVFFADWKGSAVEEIFVEEVYEGKTTKGIGIGSIRDEVHAVYGEPGKSGVLSGTSYPVDVYSAIGMQLVYVLNVWTETHSTFTYDAFGNPTEHREVIASADNSPVIGMWVFRAD